jgi:hypothetical protein
LKRRIVILNVVLAAVAVFAGIQLRNEWLAARAREAATLPGPPVKPAPVPPYTALPGAEPVLAAGYSMIPQKFLFDPSRNSTVVEVVVVTPPPPPKPMPALPRFHGEMNLDGIMAVLSEAPNSPQRFVKPGETIGEFKLLDVNTQELVFEWDGQTIHKGLNELTDRGGASSDVPGSSAAARAAPPAAPVVKTPTGPGQATPQGYKTCNPNDSTPDGTVVDGFRKVSMPTPFGAACRWDPVGK